MPPGIQAAALDCRYLSISDAKLSNHEVHDGGAGVGNSAEEDITKGEEKRRGDWQWGTSWAGRGAEMRDQ